MITPPRFLVRHRRQLMWGGLGVVGAIVIAIAAVLLFAISPLGRNLALDYAKRSLADSHTAKLSYGEVSGGWPGSIVLDDVTLADDKGPWLTVRRVTLSWYPLALLGGRVDIDKIALEAPAILRAPQGANEPEKESRFPDSFELPTLPVALNVESLTISDARIAPPVAITFAADGSFALTKGAGRIALSLKRRDGVDEHLVMDAAVDRARHALKLDVDGLAAPGGLFAFLTGWHDLPPIEIKAVGAGPPEQWRLDGHVVAGDYGRLTLGGAIVWTHELAVALKGQYAEGRAIPQPWAGLIAGQADWTLALKSASDRDTLEAGLIGTGATLRVALTKLDDRSLTGDIHVTTSNRIVLADGTALGASEIDGKIAGSLDLPKLDATIKASSLATNGVDLKALDATLNVETGRNDRTLALSANGTSGAFAFDSESGAGFRPVAPSSAFAVVFAQLPDGSWQADRISLNVPGVAIDGHAKGRANGDGEADATLIADDLRPLTAVADVDLAGRANLTVGAHWSGEGIGLSVQGRTEDTVVSGIAFKPIAGDSADILVDMSHAIDEAWVLDQARITGANGFSVQATGAVTHEVTLDGTISGDLAGLGAQIGADLAGPFDATLQARGHWRTPAMTVHLDSPSARLYGQDIGRLRADFEPPQGGPLQGEKVSGLLSLQSEAQQGRLLAVARIAEHQDRALELSDVTGDVFGGTLKGGVRLPKDGTRATGQLTLIYPDLRELAGFIAGEPRRAQGRAKLALVLGGDANAPAVKLDLSAQSVAVPEDQLGLSKLTATVTVADDGALNARMMVADGQIEALNRPFRIGALTATVTGPAARSDISLEASGLADGGGQLKARGQWVQSGKSPGLTVSMLEGNLWETPFSVTKPIVVGLAERPTLQYAALNVGSGQIAASFVPAARGFKARVETTKFPIAFLGRVLDTGWPQGEVDGTVSIDTASAQPRGTAKLTLANALFAPPGLAPVPPLSGEADATWDGRTVRATAMMDRAASTPFQLKVTLPMALDADRNPRMVPSGALNANARWNGRVGAFWALLPLDMHRLDGDGTLDVTAAGTWGNPKVTGKLGIREGHYENLETGTRLVNLDLDLDANLTEARLKLSAGDGSGGKVSGQGTVRLLPTEHFPVSAELDMTRLRVVGLDDVTATATGKATLSGNFSRLALGGKLTIDGVEAHIPDRIPPTVATLPVEYAGAPRTTANLGDTNQESSAPIDLDFDVHIPGRAYVRGRGLTSEWKGDLTLHGTLDEPDLKGAIVLVRGTLSFAGRSFPLTTGRVYFAGGGDLDPDLDVAAERQVQTTTVAITLNGRASSPNVAITAVPAVPQEDAMAYLLFGKSASSLTPLELIDVARGVAELGGIGPFAGGMGVLDKTRSALGFDVLSIDVEDKAGTSQNVMGSTAITAGRYLTNKIYVGLKQGARTGSSAVQLEVELSPHISAETEVGVDSQSSGINWKWDY